MDWLKANLWEIKQSSTLRWFGFILAFSHLLTFLGWASQNHPPLLYYSSPTPMCWSFFENCGVMRFLTAGQFSFFYYLYPILAVISGLLFVSLRLYSGGWIFLFLSFIFKTLIYFQDSRLSSNAHYLLAIAHIVYLFVPQKKIIFKYLIVSFIVAAGLLKLNGDWLSGIWIDQHMGPTKIPQKLSEWMAALSALAELILPWLLVSHKSQNIVVGFFSLAVYYVFYWFLGDGVFAGTYFLFLFFYPLYYFEQRRIEMEYLYQSYIRPEANQAWIPFVLLVFWILQALPFVKYHNPSMSLVMENLALDSVPSATECKQLSFALFKKETRELLISESQSRPDKLSCDPFIRFLDVKARCQKFSEEQGFKNIASSFMIRGLNDKKFNRVFETNHLCDQNINFRTVGQEKWTQNQEE